MSNNVQKLSFDLQIHAWKNAFNEPANHHESRASGAKLEHQRNEAQTVASVGKLDDRIAKLGSFVGEELDEPGFNTNDLVYQPAVQLCHCRPTRDDGVENRLVGDSMVVVKETPDVTATVLANDRLRFNSDVMKGFI